MRRKIRHPAPSIVAGDPPRFRARSRRPVPAARHASAWRGSAPFLSARSAPRNRRTAAVPFDLISHVMSVPRCVDRRVFPSHRSRRHAAAHPTGDPDSDTAIFKPTAPAAGSGSRCARGSLRNVSQLLRAPYRRHVAMQINVRRCARPVRPRGSTNGDACRVSAVAVGRRDFRSALKGFARRISSGQRTNHHRSADRNRSRRISPPCGVDGSARADRCEMLRICNARPARGRDVRMAAAEAAPRPAPRAESGRGCRMDDSRLIACRSRVMQRDARAISRRFAAQCERLAIRGRTACAKADSSVNQKTAAATGGAIAACVPPFAARGRAADGSPLACSGRTRRTPMRSNGSGRTGTPQQRIRKAARHARQARNMAAPARRACAACH